MTEITFTFERTADGIRITNRGQGDGDQLEMLYALAVKHAADAACDVVKAEIGGEDKAGSYILKTKSGDPNFADLVKYKRQPEKGDDNG